MCRIQTRGFWANKQDVVTVLATVPYAAPPDTSTPGAELLAGEVGPINKTLSRTLPPFLMPLCRTLGHQMRTAVIDGWLSQAASSSSSNYMPTLESVPRRLGLWLQLPSQPTAICRMLAGLRQRLCSLWTMLDGRCFAFALATF